MKKSFFRKIISLMVVCAVVLGSLSLSGCLFTNVVTKNVINEKPVVTGRPTAPVSATAGTMASEEATAAPPTESATVEPGVVLGETYDSKEEVALYIHLYGELPENYITKSEARKLGWEGGSVEKFAPGKCIGGDRYGNYEGILPEDNEYKECDIDTLGKKSRGAKRIVFSTDGDIYYTEDHYESFEVLYGEELP